MGGCRHRAARHSGPGTWPYVSLPYSTGGRASNRRTWRRRQRSPGETGKPTPLGQSVSSTAVKLTSMAKTPATGADIWIVESQRRLCPLGGKG